MGTGMAILVTAGFVVVAIAAFVGFVLLRKRGKSPEWQFVLGAVTAVVLAAVVIVASTSATSPATASQPSKEDVQQQRTDALFAALRVHQFDTTGTGQYDAQFSLDGKSGSVEVTLTGDNGAHFRPRVDFTIDAAGQYHFGCFSAGGKLWDFHKHPDYAWSWQIGKGCAPDLPDPPD